MNGVVKHQSHSPGCIVGEGSVIVVRIIVNPDALFVLCVKLQSGLENNREIV